jgi:DNA-binding NtrC family response regulator
VILLVEDNQLSRNALAATLRLHGYDVVEAANGSEALALLNARDFKLVITDVEMPVVSGLALGSYAQARWPYLPVLVISGRRFSDYVGKLTFATDFLQKPIDSATLIVTVQRLIANRNTQAAASDHCGPACRRKIGMQTWHVCANCKDWPDCDFDEILPDTASQLELCNECRLILASGRCA